ncbi:MAG: DUF4271 domain-containing protein [Bacteroidales bacterium]|jgi:hypothetical protein|nr:DUF4271 domain-containing protein [Bacteroidales bacterium]
MHTPTPYESEIFHTHPVFELPEPVEVGMFQRPSLFSEHLLKPVHAEVVPRKEPFSDWLYVLLFGCFVLYAWLLTFNIKRVGQILGATLGHRRFSRMQHNGNVFAEPFFFPFLLLVVLCFSLVVFRLGAWFDAWPLQGSNVLTSFGGIVAGVGLMYLLKVMLIKISSSIFKEQAAGMLYLQMLFVFNVSISLFFIPLLLMAFLAETQVQTATLWVMIFLFAVWYIWRGVRSFWEVKLLTKFLYVHNFLYFCTLEIGYYLLIYVVVNTVLGQ